MFKVHRVGTLKNGQVKFWLLLVATSSMVQTPRRNLYNISMLPTPDWTHSLLTVGGSFADFISSSDILT